MSSPAFDPVQAAVDALINELSVPDPGTFYLKVATLDLTGSPSTSAVVADIAALDSVDADIICLQAASAHWAGIASAYAADWEIVAPNGTTTGSRATPILLRKERFRLRKSGRVTAAGTGTGSAEVVWAVARHEESAQKIRIINTAPYLDADLAQLESYTAHVNVLAGEASKTGRQALGIVASSFSVDYRNRAEAEAWWPTRVLGNLNYALGWSFFDDETLYGLTTQRGAGALQVQAGVFARKDGSIGWAGTETVATTGSANLGVLTTYEVLGKQAEEPDDADTDYGTPDVPGGAYGSSRFKVASLNLRITLSLASARADFNKLDDAIGVDLFGFQEMQGSERRDFFGTDGLAEFADIHVQPNRTRSRGCDANPVGWRRERFAYERGSGKAVLLTNRIYFETDGDPAGKMYVTEARVRDRLSGRYVTIWSIHTPPHVENHGGGNTGMPRPEMTVRVNVLLDCMAAVRRRALQIPPDELFIVVGDLNWDGIRNVWAQRPNVFFEQGNMVTVWQALGPTGPGTLGDRFIDYIAISKRPWARFVNHGVVTDVLTDHNLPWATVEVDPI